MEGWMNLYSRGVQVLKTATFKGSGFLGYALQNSFQTKLEIYRCDEIYPCVQEELGVR